VSRSWVARIVSRRLIKRVLTPTLSLDLEQMHLELNDLIAGHIAVLQQVRQESCA
jgi:hypothetical protein